MKKIIAGILTAAFCLSIILISGEDIKANSAAQIVPVTKKVSKKVYRGGRKVTVVTYRHGKKITKTVWRKSNHIGHKVGRKTKEIVMGKSKRTP